MIALTLWHSNGLRAAWNGSQRLLERVRPDVVQLHASPEGLRAHAPAVAAEVRRLLPASRLWLGVASDTPARAFAEGRLSLERAAAQLLVASRVASELACDAVCWNGEPAYKRLSAKEPDRAPLVSLVLNRTAEAYPALVQAHTAYDQPHLHGQYPWPAFLGPSSPVRLSLPQVYVEPPDGQPLATKGALARRLADHRKSFAKVRALGWVKPENELTVLPYFRVHHTAVRDLASVWGELGGACGWAAPSRVDEHGERALLALAKLRDAGFTGPGAVTRYQASAGLAPDGVVGPKTLQALGL